MQRTSKDACQQWSEVPIKTIHLVSSFCRPGWLFSSSLSALICIYPGLVASSCCSDGRLCQQSGSWQASGLNQDSYPKYTIYWVHLKTQIMTLQMRYCVSHLVGMATSWRRAQATCRLFLTVYWSLTIGIHDDLRLLAKCREIDVMLLACTDWNTTCLAILASFKEPNTVINISFLRFVQFVACNVALREHAFPSLCTYIQIEIVEYGEAYGAHNLGRRRNTCITQPFAQECCMHGYFSDACTWCDQAKDYGLHLYNGEDSW